MKRVTVNVADEVGTEAEAIAEERDISVSQFYAEAVEAAIRKHKRQQALQRIEEDVMGDGAAVSRETFDAAQNEWRGGDDDRR
jgi:predicted transcriptional regulator